MPPSVVFAIIVTARAYQEGLFVYGSNSSFEWGFEDCNNPYITTLTPFDDDRRGAQTSVEQTELPNYYHSLPESIQKYTISVKDFDPQNPQASLKVGHGGGHHGSHPHLVHEFVMSIIEERKPWIDEIMGGNITAAGICAHESAMKNGEAITVPAF